MSSPLPRTGRPSTGAFALTAALLVMVAIVAGATWQAVRAESSNRATAERTLRDYSAVAAWHFARQANDALHNLGGPALASIDPGNGRAPDATYHPSVLLARDTAACAASEQLPARFAFRIDLPQQAIVTAGDAPGQAALAELVAKMPALMTAGGAERHRFVAPTVGGQPMRIAATLITDATPDRSPRTIYGILFDSVKLASRFRAIMDDEHLLPPALVGRAPIGERLFIAVTSPDGAVLYASGARPPSAIVATDSTHVPQGRLAVQAALDPSLAPALVIGGLPSSRLPALYALVIVAVILAAAGLIQLRRERELVRLRSRFVANVSHELRTPLAQISMFGETLMLGRERSEAERQRFATVITREARRLATIVESVLRFSRSEAGGTTLRLEPRALAAELREATEHFAPLAAAADARMRLAVDEEIAVQADPGALRQVVMNLLENAAKYGPRGGLISVSARAGDAQAVIAIEDEGPGIPSADRERVLEPFTRLERADRPKVAGTGIGLAVVDDLVRAHGGRLWIEESPGGGARVCFTLLLTSQAQARELVEMAVVTPPDGVRSRDPGLAPAAR